MSVVRLGAPFAYGMSHLERGVRVNLARRDFGIVVREPGLEGFQRFMHRRRTMEDLGRAAPDHHGARDAGTFLEIPDVVHQHRGLVHLGARFLQIGAADVAHVVLIENCIHRMKFFQRLAHLLQEPTIEHRGVERGVVGAVLVNVPAAEFEILELRERHEILDQRRAALGALAETNRRELRQRSDRRAEAALNRLDSRDERSADRADAGKQHAELAVRRRDSDGTFGRQMSELLGVNPFEIATGIQRRRFDRDEARERAR